MSDSERCEACGRMARLFGGTCEDGAACEAFEYSRASRGAFNGSPPPVSQMVAEMREIAAEMPTGCISDCVGDCDC